jgi:hypothetical protein
VVVCISARSRTSSAGGDDVVAAGRVALDPALPHQRRHAGAVDQQDVAVLAGVQDFRLPLAAVCVGVDGTGRRVGAVSVVSAVLSSMEFLPGCDRREPSRRRASYRGQPITGG